LFRWQPAGIWWERLRGARLGNRTAGASGSSGCGEKSAHLPICKPEAFCIVSLLDDQHFAAGRHYFCRAWQSRSLDVK